MGSTGRITAGELLNGELSENPELSENLYAFMRNVRGTSAYWNKAKLAIFRMLGPPTFFITLSADNMNWFDLMYVLAKCDGKSLSGNEVKELSTSERRRLLGMIVAQHFSHHFQAFMNQILNGASKHI